jgi:serine/threonine protein kinase
VRGIAAVRTFFDENGTSYFVMDYVEGVSLKAYLKYNGGKIPYEDAERILVPVMDTLATVHSNGVIHRDIAADNIYVTRDDEVKLLDFGAAQYSLGEKSHSFDAVLKPGYTPKEQYMKRSRQGPFTDVYALGATFYASLTGYLPPESLERMENDEIVEPSARGVKLPVYAEEAIMKALEVDASDRFQSMAEFKAALLGEVKITQAAPKAAPQAAVAPTPSVQPPVPASKKKPPLVPILASVGGLLVVGIVLLSVFLLNGRPDAESVGVPDNVPAAGADIGGSVATETDDSSDNNDSTRPSSSTGGIVSVPPDNPEDIKEKSLDEVGFYDPNYNYSANPRYKVAYIGSLSFIYNTFDAAFACWATLSNVDYTGSCPDNDVFIDQIIVFAEQGYDGALIDADMFLYPRIAEICAEINLPWMSVTTQPVKWNDDYVSGEMLHPYIGFDQRAIGTETAKKLVEYKNYVWPDATPQNTALLCLDFGIAFALHERALGAAEYWTSQGYPEGGVIIADPENINLSAAYTLTAQTVSGHSEYKYWLVCAVLDDFALGAAQAFDDSGLTDNACVASVLSDGITLYAQWDSGVQSAWRFAYTIPYTIYSEPIFFALYSFMSGQATPDTIWPSWVNYGDPQYGTTYAQLLLPTYCMEYDSYKKVLAWSDIYSGANIYYYDKTGISRDDYPARAIVPDYYRKSS